MNQRRLIVSIVIVFIAASMACKSKDDAYKPKINPEFLTMTKEELFEKGEALFEKEKWRKSREYYQYVYENFPNDRLASTSLMRIADTYFKEGGEVNMVEAQYKYRDFMNRYPTDSRADYAMLQIANVAYEQMEKPDRDQTNTYEAIKKYQEMIQLFPASPHRGDAEQRLAEAKDNLAAHDHKVAKFYLKRADPKAALPRLEHVRDEYPNYVNRADLFFDLGVALDGLGREGEAKLYFERVLTEFPGTDVAEDAQKELAKHAG